ncbi:Mth938-like domain-containing protein [Telmatospirillum sp. J64-1]|uniref:Mth938-like domain-containing protein n=1 Tax=Telmatospirillum sp. J64-1 TaxID=2502183 RepID=UPI00115EACA5|nr:Mth938-like domain-containing protein [Telmatospirillum sp. J64-1]
MDITPVVPGDRQLIQGYGEGGFRISGVRHEGSVLVHPFATLAWPVSGMEEVSAESLMPLRDAEPRIEILLIGCGERTAMLPRALRESFRSVGIVIEGMDTGAACRTYNVLLSEERRVAAALLAI